MTGNIAAATLILMVVLFVSQVTGPLAHCPPGKPTRIDLAWTLAAILVVLMIAGCATAPEPVDRPVVSCEPIRPCDIPPAANSTQLEAALWACVLELRAQYRSCAERQQTKLPPTAYGTYVCHLTNPPECFHQPAPALLTETLPK